MFGFLKKKHSDGIEDVSETLLYKQSNFLANEAYKLLRANISFTLPDTGKCRIIGITSATRGETKSTTAINLSYVLAEKGSRTLLIEHPRRIRQKIPFKRSRRHEKISHVCYMRYLYPCRTCHQYSLYFDWLPHYSPCCFSGKRGMSGIRFRDQ